MSDLDLDDLESRLYSQVYHGQPEEPEANTLESPADSLPTVLTDMGKQSGRYFGTWGPSPRHNPPRSKNFRTPNRKSLNKSNSQSTYSKNSDSPRRPPSTLQQVILVSPEKPTAYMTSKEKSKARWKAKMKERVQQKRAQKSQKSVKESAVITLSDSEEDDDSCILIDNDWPLLSVVDSDDESDKNEENETVVDPSVDATSNITLKSEPVEPLNESLSDDVIFVEPVVVPPVVIDIDEECENVEKTTHISSGATDHVGVDVLDEDITQQQQIERRELLNTPDSASNDFINNTELELNQTSSSDHQFNFSLHGSDFQNSTEFLRPAARHETCETESSSSTTDPHASNLVKTAVFNEVDFPRDIFSENNLESFGNFITPLRNSQISSVHSSPCGATDSSRKSVLPSDSSFENESEELQSDRTKELRSKQLPELSPMHTCVPQQTKRRKKSSLCSKYDLLDSAAENKEKDVGKKKRKRNRKRKSGVGGGNEEDVGRNAEVEEGGDVADDVRRKKRRSSQLENSQSCEAQHMERMASDDTENVNSGDTSLAVEPVSTVSNANETDQNDKDVSSQNVEGIACEESTTKEVTELQENPLENIEEDTQLPEYNDQVTSESILEGLAIVDELPHEESSIVLLSSDSEPESVLSPLRENSDILLNFENPVQDCTADVEPGTAACVKKDLGNFSVKDIQMDMSSDPSLWAILDSDRFPSTRGRGPKCKRCKQFGHMRFRCPNQVEVKCTLCGGSGHIEPRCPNKMCNQCGKRSLYSTNYCGSCFKLRKRQCPICAMPGHLSDTCPDLWRRYHLTTKDGPPVPASAPAPTEKRPLWCSGCAQSGHLEHDCRAYRSIYPPTDPFIQSYAPVYEKNREDTRDTETREEPRTERPTFVPRHTPPPPPPPRWPTPRHALKQRPLLPTPPVKPPLFRGTRPVFRGSMPRHHQMPDFRLNQFNHNQLYQSFEDQSSFAGNNFGQNSFRQVNYVGPCFDGIFVGNQQNFFPTVDPNLVRCQQNYGNQIPSNFFQNREVVFKDAMPDYISLEPERAPEGSYEESPQAPSGGRYLKNDKMTRKAFFSSTSHELKGFIKAELQRLSKLAVASDRHVKAVKKMQCPKKKGPSKQDYYEKVNMLLFGVLNLVKGKSHLDRLKQFKMGRMRSRVDYDTRNKLYDSYQYIFGREKNTDVQYPELLRTI